MSHLKHLAHVGHMIHRLDESSHSPGGPGNKFVGGLALVAGIATIWIPIIGIPLIIFGIFKLAK